MSFAKKYHSNISAGKRFLVGLGNCYHDLLGQEFLQPGLEEKEILPNRDKLLHERIIIKLLSFYWLSCFSRGFFVKRKKILVVEDDNDYRNVLFELFTRKGYELVCAASAEDALALLNREIMVMFLDLKLQGKMNGLELCQLIRRQYPEAYIFAMTGHSTLFELTDCRKVGFDDYFTKPTRLEVLLMAAEQAFVGLERRKGPVKTTTEENNQNPCRGS